MTKTKKRIIWASLAIVIVVFATIFLVEYWQKSGSQSDSFPLDGMEASLKMSGKGYYINIQDNRSALQTISRDASAEYSIAFNGTMTSYIEVGDKANTGMIQAQIFYFEYNADAKLLYQAMLEKWTFEKEEGELRYRDNVVYMGYGAVLDDFEN